MNVITFNQYIEEGSSDYKKISLELEAKEHHLGTILSILKLMEQLGSDGSSRTIKVFVDGDGAFKLKVKSNNPIQPHEYSDDDISFSLE